MKKTRKTISGVEVQKSHASREIFFLTGQKKCVFVKGKTCFFDRRCEKINWVPKIFFQAIANYYFRVILESYLLNLSKKLQ
jgi:hypothetical protein